MKTGLIISPREQKDSVMINELLQNSDFYAEYNREFKSFFLPEEEDNYDEFEKCLNELLSECNYIIEGIFN